MSYRPLEGAVAAGRVLALQAAAAHADGVLHLLDKARKLLESREPADHRRAVTLIERVVGLLPQLVDAAPEEQGRAMVAAVQAMTETLSAATGDLSAD